MEETSAEVEEELFTRPLLSVASWLNPPRLKIWPLAYGSSPNICSSDNLTSSEAHPLLLPSLTREFLSLALFWRCGSKKSLFLSLKWPSDRNLRMLSISSFVGTLDSSARANCKNPIVSQIRPLSCREHILPLFPAPNLRSVATRPETFSRFHQHTLEVIFQVSLLLRWLWKIGKTGFVWPFILLQWKSFGWCKALPQSNFEPEWLSATHSLTHHCCEMHLWNLVLSPTQLWETLTQKPDNPCKLTQIIQCNGFQILSQVLINVSFRQYWIQLYFLTLLHALIGSLEYFQSFESGENGKMIDVEERILGRFTIWAFSPKTLKFNIWRFKFVSNGKIRILCFRLLAWESDTPQSVNFKSIDWK